MAHGQDYSDSQRKIIDRYYDHKDTIATQKLGEIVSDLYVCDDPRKADQLWDRAAKALANVTANRVRMDKVLAERKVEALAQLVNDLALSAKAAPKPGPSGPDQSNPPVSPVPAQSRPAEAGQATAPAPTPATPPASPTASVTAPASGSFTPDDLKAALKAFRKRLKLTRLDEESGLGRSPLTGGKKSQIIAIQPPNQFPPAVWQELAKQGRLKPSGRGFYELLEP